MKHLRCSRTDGVETILLARPPVNALSGALCAELGQVAMDLVADPDLNAVVIAGEGKAFAAGADITEFETGGSGGAAPGIRAAFDAIAAIPRPVIAAIHGYALGGGAELALACDLRIVADTARLGFPEILLGIIPGAGGTQRLPRLVGPARAKELIWTGRQIGADEALAIGLVDRVVAADAVLAEAQAWAASFATGAVVAMGLAKQAVDRGLDGPIAAGLDLEARAFAAAFATDDARIGVRSFLEHGPGKATFTGR